MKYGILSWILEQKKKNEKMTKSEEDLRLVYTIASMSSSWFWSFEHLGEPGEVYENTVCTFHATLSNLNYSQFYCNAYFATQIFSWVINVLGNYLSIMYFTFAYVQFLLWDKHSLGKHRKWNPFEMSSKNWTKQCRNTWTVYTPNFYQLPQLTAREEPHISTSSVEISTRLQITCLASHFSKPSKRQSFWSPF